MGQNLRDRLRRLRETKRQTPAPEETRAAPPERPEETVHDFGPAWRSSGHRVVRRTVTLDTPRALPPAFSNSLAILIPDLLRGGKIPLPGELLFFDLETTGLSGGAGTLAFLAAFGRFVTPSRLEITQYLLLDYPGESDFIESAAKEFARTPPPVAVSFNGKSFDSQILKTRCLMNGIMVPEYRHADLLHPARRLWKRRLPDCSQATIEENILGLDRRGDVSGALAPEIWFSFLRSGETRDLLSICDHNVRDIQGLAALFLAFGKIAEKPFAGAGDFFLDEEALALVWNGALRKNAGVFGEPERRTGDMLLESAAARGFPRAAFAAALAFFQKGRQDEARALMLKIAEDAGKSGLPETEVSGGLGAAAFKVLAVDAEWRGRDFALALRYTASALALPGIPEGFRRELEKRRVRLEEKQETAAAPREKTPEKNGAGKIPL